MPASWFQSIFMYLFAPTPADQLKHLRQLQLAQQQLDAIHTSKEALVEAYEHFSKKLMQFQDKKEELEEERLEELIECETQEDKEYLESVDEELRVLDEKIVNFERKLREMRQNIDFLERSEQKTQGYIDMLYDQVRFASRDGTIEWNRDEFDLGDMTVDSFPVEESRRSVTLPSTTPRNRTEERAIANTLASLQV